MTGGLNQTKECGTQNGNGTLKEMTSGRYSTRVQRIKWKACGKKWKIVG